MSFRKSLMLTTLLLSSHIIMMGQSTVGYLRPAGSYYLGVTADWKVYAVTQLEVAPWVPYVYKNVCSEAAAAVWTMRGETVSADGDSNLRETVEPIPDGYLEKYLPTISLGSESYTLGQNNQSWAETDHTSIVLAGVLSNKSLCDPGEVVGTTSSGTKVTNFFDINSGYKYPFGTMSISYQGVAYPNCGVAQLFPKPMSPLYVKGVSIPVISYSEQPIPAGKSLTLRFCKVDESGGDKVAGETIAQYDCTADNLTVIGSKTSSLGAYQQMTMYIPTEGLLLSDEFFVEITGFQQEGVDIGVTANYRSAADASFQTRAQMYVQDGAGQRLGGYLTNGFMACINLYSMFDGVKTMNKADSYLLTAPAEGGVCKNSNNTSVQLKTAIAWEFTSATPNYQLVGMPDWLSLSVDESKRDLVNSYTFGHGVNTLTFTAEPMPMGETERTAVIYVEGKGVCSDEPIVVTQRAAEPSALSSVKASEGAPARPGYNLQGQRSGDNLRAVVIRNGRKVLCR